MGRPLWFTAIIKSIFPGRYLLARATHLPLIGTLVDHMLFAGDDMVYLPNDRTIYIHESVPSSVDIVIPSQVVEHFIQQAKYKPKLWSTQEDLAAFTAGLSIHALRQLLLRASYTREPLTPADLVGKVQEFIQSQLGEDVVEFKKPSHRLDDVKGNQQLKRFIRHELLPRFRAPGDKALAGAAVAALLVDSIWRYRRKPKGTPQPLSEEDKEYCARIVDTDLGTAWICRSAIDNGQCASMPCPLLQKAKDGKITLIAANK